MGGEAGDLVAETLGLDDSNVVDDSLIYMEVVGQLAVVLLNQCSGGSLNSLGPYSALECYLPSLPFLKMFINNTLFSLPLI